MTTQIRPVTLTNTLNGKKEKLVPAVPGKLTFYSCGPTVYNFIHIGNLRGGLVADMFYRYFRRIGYEVTYVRNYTDVDDKIINRAREEGLEPSALAKKYTLEVEKDYAVSGMLEPTHKTTVTTHIPRIITMIEAILAKGLAYVIEGGEVLFSIDGFPTYGKLSQKKLDDLMAGARVEVNTKKHNPLDFALWKPAKPGEPFWPSPWGDGRPGWHIECSAMASQWLGDQIDVHHGGEDLIFPHHENEIAQSEAACGKAPFVRYWLHHAFLTLSKTKMSKSLGNVFLAREFLTQFSGEVARALLLSVHYRSVIDFGKESLEQTFSFLQRIYEAKHRACQIVAERKSVSDARGEALWGEFLASCDKARAEMDECFANDFNTPGVLAALFGVIRDYNRTLAEPLALATPSAILGSQELLRLMEEEMGGILGIGRGEPQFVLKELARMRQSVQEGEGILTQRVSESEILAAIEARALARREKNFNQADEIRKSLEGRGVLIKDGAAGTTWEYK